MIFDFKERDKRKGAGRRAIKMVWGDNSIWRMVVSLTRVLFLLGGMYADVEYVSHMIIFSV